MKITSSKKHNCLICGQWMDLEVISCRKTPFIDGKTYAKMCFTCFNVPEQEIQKYDDDGNIEEVLGPFYDHKHIHKATDMVEWGICDNLKEARACIKAVKEKCKGMKKPITHKRPKQEFS
jgi:hypothetical protein